MAQMNMGVVGAPSEGAVEVGSVPGAFFASPIVGGADVCVLMVLVLLLLVKSLKKVTTRDAGVTWQDADADHGTSPYRGRTHCGDQLRSQRR